MVTKQQNKMWEKVSEFINSRKSMQIEQMCPLDSISSGCLRNLVYQPLPALLKRSVRICDSCNLVITNYAELSCASMPARSARDFSCNHFINGASNSETLSEPHPFVETPCNKKKNQVPELMDKSCKIGSYHSSLECSTICIHVPSGSTVRVTAKVWLEVKVKTRYAPG